MLAHKQARLVLCWPVQESLGTTMPGTDNPHEDGQQCLDQQQSPLQQHLFVPADEGDQPPAVRPDGVAPLLPGQVGFRPTAPQELLGQLAHKEEPFELSATGLQQGTTAADFFSSKTHKVRLHAANMGILDWTCCLTTSGAVCWETWPIQPW